MASASLSVFPCAGPAAAAILAVAALAPTGALAQSYQVVELPAPPGRTAPEARAINSLGHAAGHCKEGASNFRPVVWINGTATELPLPPGYPGAGATGIADTGAVCGSAWTQGSFGFSAAVLWQGGTPSFLPTLGGQYSAADGISPSGVVTGWTSSYGQTSGPRAFRFDGSTVSAGVIQGGGGSWTNGNAINAAGQVVGMGMTSMRFHHAFLDDPAEGMMNLGTLGGLTSQALAISSAGHVAGWSQTGAREPSVGDGIVAHAFLWHKGRMTDLGVLPGKLESRALGVNASGTVVGRCSSPPWGSPTIAFVWSNGTLTDLNTAIPAGSGWTLRSANAINDAGRIVGAGERNGQPAAFMLIPNP